MKGQTYILLAIIFAVVIAVFAVINVDPVEVNYLFGTGNAPLILVILFSVLMGGVITASVGLFKMVRLQREVKSLKKKNQDLETNSSIESNRDTAAQDSSNSSATTIEENDQTIR